MAAAIILLVAWWIGARSTPATLGVIVATALSSPFALFLVGLGAIGAVLRRPGWGSVLLATSVSTLIQMIVIVSTPRQPPGQEPFIPSLVAVRYMRDVLGLGAFGPTRLPISWLVPAGVVLVAAIAVGLVIVGRQGPATVRQVLVREAPAHALFVMAALSVCGFVMFVAMNYLQHKYNLRYSYIPAVLVCAGLVLGAALIRDVRPPGDGRLPTILAWAARLALPVSILVLAYGFSRTFRMETKASDGPDYVAAYRSASAACTTDAGGTIRVPISPIGAYDWVVEIPCSRVQSTR
jgi:hypothetical protein